VLTVDVECWGQSVLDRSLPVLPHSAENVRRLLDLFAEFGSRATLFVLGKFAERHPDVVGDAQSAGHEIASHGHGHVEVHRLTPAAFREDVRRASDLIAAITGQRPRGYRAPVFSIGRQNLWALDVLADEEHAYDASIFPFAGPRYGIGDWPTGPCRVELGGGRSIVEYPLTVLRFAGARVPIAGGGYARLMPAGVLLRALRHEARRRAHPPVFYCHPYEIDPGEIARHYPHVSLRRSLHQGLGRGSFMRKLRHLLTAFECVPLRDALMAASELPVLRLAEHTTGATPVRVAVARSESTAHSAASVGSGTSTYS
jgi:polysaccharide deacetylase family protein (PEP-CTERM system associated)